MSNEQTTAEVKLADFMYIRVNPDGSVRFRTADIGFVTISAEDFTKLVEVQQRAVWAAQHWTSLAQVNAALDTLLSVYPQIQLVDVMGVTDGMMQITSYEVRLRDEYGTLESYSTNAQVSALFQRLSAPKVEP